MDNSTIIALATPIGQAPLAVLRVSGPETLEITHKIFRSSKDFRKSHGFEIFLGYIYDPRTHEDIDQVLLSVFKSPRSFTGEDMIEITCHGGLVSFQTILDLYFAMGAIPAERGEFSKRAFFNGKMDLTQAEAIHDLVLARSSSVARTALNSLKKNFFQTLQNIKNILLSVVAKIEVGIDYSEEYEKTFDLGDQETLEKLRDDIQSMILQSEKLVQTNKGHMVGIIGDPNAGKSSLLNTLIGEQKAIVSERAGTTRDPIEVAMFLDDIPLTLVDTAGLREETKDDIEQQGIQKSVQIMSMSDFVLLVIDSQDFSLPRLWEHIRWLEERNIPLALVWNKQDLVENFQIPYDLLSYEKIFFSCQTKAGIEGLLDLLKKFLHKTDALETQFLFNQRQSNILLRLQDSIEQSLDLAAKDEGGELISLSLQNALKLVGELDGSNLQEDILDTIFSQFCLGK